MNVNAVVSIVAGLLAANCVNAAEVGTSISLGSTGLGLHLSTPITSKLNARLGLNYASYSYNGNTDDVDYDFKLKLATIDALLDYHPMDGAFRISGGVVYNGNNIDAVAKPNASQTYTFNGRTYSAQEAGNITGKIDFRKAAPYLGIGWGNSAKGSGWGFGMDLGVTFQGSPKTELAHNGCTASANECEQLSRDVAEENKNLKEEVKDFKLYPVVRAGISYKF
jgi:opacity protein-like surface antigen